MPFSLTLRESSILASFRAEYLAVIYSEHTEQLRGPAFTAIHLDIGMKEPTGVGRRSKMAAGKLARIHFIHAQHCQQIEFLQRQKKSDFKFIP